MVTNMACPKCGGKASEYDANKWACLECGNKFVYTPPPIPQTFQQTNISIAGSSLFDLEAQKAAAPQPIFRKKILQMPGYFDEIGRNEEAIERIQGSRLRARIGSLAYIPFMAAFGLLTLLAGFASIHFCMTSEEKSFGIGLGVAAAGFGLLLAVLYMKFTVSRWRLRKMPQDVARLQNRNQQLISEKDDDMLVAHNILCPYCSRCAMTVAVDHEMPKPGLEHCLACGKQYFTTNGYTYPIVFK